LLLERRINCERREAKCFHWRFQLAEKNVPDYPVTSFGHQRNDDIVALPKILHEFCFGRSTKSQPVNFPNSIPITLGFTSNIILCQRMPESVVEDDPM
jgi:hypothetical protein